MAAVLDTSEAPRTATHTIRDAILHSSALLNTLVRVEGRVSVLDTGMGRMDIVRDGGKLIVRIAEGMASGVAVGEEVLVSGTLRKEERRTFLEACGVEKGAATGGE
eukprot:Hpha_TRINITY_DN13839_c0_g1::TRINITY_DN13839_c0_g1_i2::g.69582::m.69582